MDASTAIAEAKEKYVGMDIHKGGEEALAKLAALPASCEESAACLKAARGIFEKNAVFPARMVDGIIKALESFHDRDLLTKAVNDTEKVKQLVDKYFYCG